uniref:Uncharacterized protein n=1 Tax=Timema genevievae TaxID=629358 RepID=A0A7R9K549_TIMGE|nr:unnamed protein product [Timema genevievae]
MTRSRATHHYTHRYAAVRRASCSVFLPIPREERLTPRTDIPRGPGRPYEVPTVDLIEFDPTKVFLLYSRDCPEFMKVMSSLNQFLEKYNIKSVNARVRSSIISFLPMLHPSDVAGHFSGTKQAPNVGLQESIRERLLKGLRERIRKARLHKDIVYLIRLILGKARLH